MSRVYLDMLHAHKVISRKIDKFCAVCKKDKFIFFTQGKKNYRFYVKFYMRT
jgi:hypothetical protein